MTTKEQARKAREELSKMFPISTGLSQDESGYFVKVHLPCYSTYKIPTILNDVRVETVIVGTLKSYLDFKNETANIDREWDEISATDSDSLVKILRKLWSLNKEMLLSIRKLESEKP